MKDMTSIVKRFLREDDGAAAVEYGLLVALIAAVIIVAVTSLGTNVRQVFCLVITKLAEIPGITGAASACS